MKSFQLGKLQIYTFQALSYMSASILPDSAIQPLLDMTKKISHSSSYKTKLSMLEYIQVKHDFFL